MFSYIENEVDLEALKSLTQESLKELIPKVGPQIKFYNKLRLYQDLEKMPVVIEVAVIDGEVTDTPSTSTSDEVYLHLYCFFIRKNFIKLLKIRDSRGKLVYCSEASSKKCILCYLHYVILPSLQFANSYFYTLFTLSLRNRHCAVQTLKAVIWILRVVLPRVHCRI